MDNKEYIKKLNKLYDLAHSDTVCRIQLQFDILKEIYRSDEEEPDKNHIEEVRL